MKPLERALQALRTLVQFEVAQTGAEVARLAEISARARRETEDLERRCEATAQQLRAALQRPPIDPASFVATRKLYKAQRLSLFDSRVWLKSALEDEQNARDMLAELRNRERSLDRALPSQPPGD
jgi:hypothetical protein